MKALKSLIFILIITIIGFSCKKNSDNSETSTSVNGKIYYRYSNDNSDNELWSLDLNTKSKSKINLKIPSGWHLGDEDMAEISQDEKTLTYFVYDDDEERCRLYKSKIDGTDTTLIISTDKWIGIQGIVANKYIYYYLDNEQLWSVSLDGSNNHKISINLPTNWVLGDEELAKFSSDGTTMFFLSNTLDETQVSIYSSAIDGTNLASIFKNNVGSNNYLAIQDIINNSKVLYRFSSSDNNTLWTIDTNGQNNNQLSIPFTSGYSLNNEEMSKSIDSDKILLVATSGTTKTLFMYSLSTKILSKVEDLDNSATGDIALQFFAK